jgi:hypothetical protein
MPIEGLTPGPANPQPLSFSGVHTAPAFDVANLLPPAASERLLQLRQRAKDSHAVIPPFEEVRTASMARIEAANSLKRLTDHPQHFGMGLKADAPQAVAAQRLLDKLSADFQRLQKLQATCSAAWNVATQALARVQDWLKSGRPAGVALEDVDTAVKLAKGEANWLEAIANRQRRVKEIKADLRRTQDAPFPSAWAREKMRAEIEARAATGAPSTSLLVERGDKIDWPMQPVRAQVYGVEGAFAAHAAVDPVGLLCWLFKDAMIAALEGEIATEACDEEALTIEERQRRESELLGDLLEKEMLEGGRYVARNRRRAAY